MINNAIIQGRFTATPELRYTGSDKAVTTFTLAVSRGYKDKGGAEITDFINCVAWGKTAEFAAKYFKKGTLAAAQGSIEMRKYEDKDGNKRTAFEINVKELHFCESKKDGGSGDDTMPAPVPATSGEDFDDELPF